MLAVADQSRRNVGDAPVERIPDCLAEGIGVLARVHFRGEERMVEASGYQQARERAQPGQPVLVVVLVQGRMPKARGRPPTERAPGVFRGTDIHCTIDQHVKVQAASCTKLQRADTTLRSIVQDHTPDTTQRRQVAREARQCRAIELSAMDSHDFSTGTRSRGAAARSDPDGRRRFPATGWSDRRQQRVRGP